MQGEDPPQGGGIRVALAKGGRQRDASAPPPASYPEDGAEEELDFDGGGDLDEAEREAGDVLVDDYDDDDDDDAGEDGGDWREGGEDGSAANPAAVSASNVDPGGPEPTGRRLSSCRDTHAEQCANSSGSGPCTTRNRSCDHPATAEVATTGQRDRRR